MRPVLELSGVQVQRGRKTVLDIDILRLNKGELVSVIGPNGAGKSTLLQVIDLLLPVNAGTIKLYGEDAGRINPREQRRRAGLVFQEPLLIKDTVFNNVALPLKLRGVTQDERVRRVKQALALFGCSHLVNRLAHRLSGGEAQRVSLARAMACDPELLLLDEPFSALDPATRHLLTLELRQVAEEREMTVILVSHNLSDVLHFTERAVVLEDGRIVQDDKPETVLRKPATKSVAQMVGMDNILPLSLEATTVGALVKLSETVRFEGQAIPPQVEGWCCLPGDVFHIFGDESVYGSPWVVLEVMVRKAIPGIGVYHLIADGPGFPLNMKVSREQAGRVAQGSRITVAFHPQDAHIV